MVCRAAAFGACPGAHHERSVLVADDRHLHRHGHLHVHGVGPGNRPAHPGVHDGAADDGRPDRRQRVVAAVLGAARRARGARGACRRVARIRRMGDAACEKRPSRQDAHGASGRARLRGRLFQLHDGGGGDASRDRSVPHQPREARLDHRLFRGARVHHRPGVELGGCRGRLSGGKRVQHLRRVHPV